MFYVETCLHWKEKFDSENTSANLWEPYLDKAFKDS